MLSNVMTIRRGAFVGALSTVLTLVALSLAQIDASAQQTIAPRKSNSSSQSKQNGGKKGKDETILPHVKAWRMTDDFTLADTVVVDTILAEHQVHNPIWRRSPANVTLGNLGSPSIPTFYPALRRDKGDVFYNSLLPIMLNPEDFTFYNTKTPYANLTYQKGIPKARREEFFSALFTQNINKKANIGAKLDINASIGRYEAMSAYNSKFGFWLSVDGDVYKTQLQAWYQRFEIAENGGITNDSIVLTPELFDYDKAEDYPVLFMDAQNRLATYRLLWSNSIDLGFVTRTEGDSVEYDVPVATAFYKFYIDKSHHEFTIDDLSTYDEDVFPKILDDPSSTHDSRKYMLISNMFQLKLNEEFNSALRFGLRLFIGNDFRQYYWDDSTQVVIDLDTETASLLYQRQKHNNTSTYMGGQIFKNIGTHVRWNAGLKYSFLGYNAGDVTANGQLNVTIGSGKWATDVWAKARFELRTPSLWEDEFHSNHYNWGNNIGRSGNLTNEKNLDIMGGIRVPAIGVDVSVFSATLTDRVYFDANGVPQQADDPVEIFGAYARAHLHQSHTNFNTIIRLAAQRTSDSRVMPVPSFALYATSYWERLFFGVLLTQIGFDVHYNTQFYSPAYIPAIMQFVPQDERKTGNYGYFDPFINFHLKKIRAYVKMEHINNLWGSNDHFNTVHYPANPQTFKFGLSWNFYD